MTTESGYGAEYAIQYLDKMAAVFGFEIVPPLILDVRPGKVSEENKQLNREKSIKAMKIFLSRMAKKEKKKPSINVLVPFHIFKLVSELDPKLYSADYEYYKDKKDYYYDSKINPIKTMIAKRVARKTIFG
jgi:hypothetical protein